MIRVLPDVEELSRACAELLVATARRAVADHGRFSLALCGGTTPRRTLRIARASTVSRPGALGPASPLLGG